MGRTNGGIVGKSNKASFGKCTQTVKTSSGDVTLQSGTRVVEAFMVAGGGAGGQQGGGAGLVARLVERRGAAGGGEAGVGTAGRDEGGGEAGASCAVLEVAG